MIEFPQALQPTRVLSKLKTILLRQSIQIRQRVEIVFHFLLAGVGLGQTPAVPLTSFKKLKKAPYE